MREKITSSLYGLAIGDGFGFLTEFRGVERILEIWPPNGPQEPEGNPIIVSDDTQMTLAFGKALALSEADNYAPLALSRAIRSTFVDWLNDPENNRAPGNTCIVACEELERGKTWQDATVKGSKGCGANMRVIPAGLLAAKGISSAQIAKIAQLQAAMTHAHPTALTASDLTAMAIVQLLNGMQPQDLLPFLLDYAQSQRTIYHDDYLLDIWQRPALTNPQQFIAKGWDEAIAALQKVQIGLDRNDQSIDPCLITGEGWIAEEALATALLCFLYSPDNPVQVLRRAVLTNGDSDSIACIAGGLTGAYYGQGAFPQDWLDRIEYQQELNELIHFFTT